MGPSREDESDAEFRLGDAVALCGMPANSGLNGSKGILMKPMGKERWVVKVENDDKTKVVTVKNLCKVGASLPRPDVKYSILGTWDDWEPHEMAWDGRKSCFAGEVTIGQSGEEDFKILQEEDWSRCVHPDREKANAWDGHSIKGPDDGGYDSEWTIGRHQNDRTSKGAVFVVRLFVSADDARPLRVSWELAKPSPEAKAQENAQESPPSKEETIQTARQRHLQRSRQRSACDGPAPREASTEPAAQPPLVADTKAPPEQASPVKSESPPVVVKEHTESGRVKQHASPGAAWDLDASGGFVWRPRAGEVKPDDGDYKKQEKDVLDTEREARIRLEKRLEAAARAESKALEDKHRELHDRDEDRSDQKLREMMAHQRQRIQADWKQWNYEQFQALRGANQPRPECCADCWAPLPAGPRETRTTCAKCHAAYEQICAAGWDASVITTCGYRAGDHAQWLSETRNIALGAARQMVMKSYPASFVPRPPA